MKSRDRFDSLIQYHARGLPYHWLWVKAQVSVESAFKPQAVSSAGAQGLLQLMPATDLEIDGVLDGFEIEGNLDNGIRYLLDQYEHLAEIPNPFSRLRCALASYNGGRGYINAALALGRKQEGQPGNYKKWVAAGKPAGRWQTWPTVAANLQKAKVRGRKPDHQQMTDYVERITAMFIAYATEAIGGTP